MKRHAKRLFTACLATMVTVAASEVIAAGESAAETQDLVNVRAAGQVTASWTRQSGYYALQVVMEVSKPRPPRAGTTANPIFRQPPPTNMSLDAEEMRQLGIVNVADELKRLSDELKKLVPSAEPAIPNPGAGGAASLDRSSFFIGNTIAKLRGLDPTFGCRTLTLVNGPRTSGEQTLLVPSAQPAAEIQSYPPMVRHPRIEVWLLKADGTQILPKVYSCVTGPAVRSVLSAPEPAPPLLTKQDQFSYRYSVADSEQAVAAAIRIDDDFYIEKLQPLQSRPAAQ